MKIDTILVPKRIEAEEILDRNNVPIDDAVQSFADLQRINRLFGGIAVYKKSFHSILKSYPDNRPLSLLDIGTGTADLAIDLLKRCNSRDRTATITGLDLKFQFVQLAKKRHSNNGRLQVVVSDAFKLPFKKNSYDIVISNLVMHHFHNRSHEILSEMYRVARYTVVVNDLLRHRIPLLFFRIFSPLFVSSPITRHDGQVSLRRAFSFPEIQQIMKKSNFTNYYFIRHWSFRFGLVIWKKRW